MTVCSASAHPADGWIDLEVVHPDVRGLGVRLRYRDARPAVEGRKPTPAVPATVAVIHHIGGPLPVSDPGYFDALAAMCTEAARWLRDMNGWPEDGDGQGRLV